MSDKPSDTPNLPEVIRLIPQAMACIPIEFKDSLPPRLFTRYQRFHRALGEFLKKVLQLQADLSGQAFHKQDWLEALSRSPAHKPLPADLTGCFAVMKAMQHSLPEQPQVALSDEHLDGYYTVLQEHARLQLECERLQEALQKQGLL